MNMVNGGSSKAGFIIGAFLALAGTAHAGFIGKTIGAEPQYPTQGSICCGSGQAVVGAGVEFPEGSFSAYNSSAYVDVSDTQIEYGQTAGTGYGAATFNGFHFFDVFASIDPIVSVGINPATNLAGFDLSRLSFDADNIYINLQGLEPADPHFVRLDVQFGSAAAVPEPSSILLLGSSLAGLALALRRRRA